MITSDAFSFPLISSFLAAVPPSCDPAGYKLRNVVVVVVYSGNRALRALRKSKGRQRQIPSIRDAVKKVTIESPMPREEEREKRKKKAAMEGGRGFSIMPTTNERKNERCSYILPA